MPATIPAIATIPATAGEQGVLTSCRADKGESHALAPNLCPTMHHPLRHPHPCRNDSSDNSTASIDTDNSSGINTDPTAASGTVTNTRAGRNAGAGRAAGSGSCISAAHDQGSHAGHACPSLIPACPSHLTLLLPSPPPRLSLQPPPPPAPGWPTPTTTQSTPSPPASPPPTTKWTTP